MEHMSLQEITTACGGTYYGEPSLLTREVSPSTAGKPERIFYLSRSKEPE